jgi:hypothetical protein
MHKHLFVAAPYIECCIDSGGPPSQWVQAVWLDRKEHSFCRSKASKQKEKLNLDMQYCLFSINGQGKRRYGK